MMQIDKLTHLEIMREEAVSQYRFRSNPTAPKPPQRTDRSQHGQKLKSALEQTEDSIILARKTLGIDPVKFMVMSLTSCAMSPDILDNMLRKFNLSLIEEINTDTPNGSYILVQFPDSDSLAAFKYERELWTLDTPDENILTYAQRRDLFSCIEDVRKVTREDRIGPRLRKQIQTLPEGFFIVDIDIWHDGDRQKIFSIERMIRTALGNLGSTLLGDLFETPSLLLGRVKVNAYSLNALLELDVVATIDLPMGTVSEEACELFSYDFEPVIDNRLDENAPLAAVLDSGVFSGHPLLQDVIVAEEDFDLTESTTADLNGHGTGVAGIVVYGDFYKSIDNRVFTPLVRICNGKIMHNECDNPVFSEGKRPEQIVKEAIEFFHREYNCRVFNLSAGHLDRVYNNGRQMPWAETLDRMARELDVVIIISAGNVINPEIPQFEDRDQIADGARNQLFETEHKLIDPATASLCVTVGSISRSDEPQLVQNRSLRMAVGPKNSPSVFTRIGKGVNKSVKPELVDFGGNYAIHQIQRGNNRWLKMDWNLMEPTLHNTHEKLFKGYCGTSFAAPRVTHLAARIEKALMDQIGEPPSANLIRALLVNSASFTQEMGEWAENSTDRHDNRQTNAKQERRMRLLGYGQASASVLYSGRNQVTLFAEDLLPLRSFHLYKIPVPLDFLKLRSKKQIAVSLAYNPVARLSRKDYLANNLWFEVYRKVDEESLIRFKAKKEAGEDVDTPSVPNEYKADFTPGYTEVDSSTLQNRVWSKGERGGGDLIWNEDEPYIWILVAGKEKFKHAEQERPQQYSLVITFSYQGDQDIQLYNKLQQRANIKERQTIRERVQIRR